MKTGLAVVIIAVAISAIHALSVSRPKGQNGNSAETKPAELQSFAQSFGDLSEDENAMIVVFFDGDLSKMSADQMKTLRAKWDQLKSSGTMPQCNNDQKTKLQQIWRKHKQSGGGQVSNATRSEMENVCTKDQMQKITALRQKTLQENGSSYAQFFKQKGQVQMKETRLFTDLTEDENAMIVVFFNGNLQKLTSGQKSTLRAKWEQLKVCVKRLFLFFSRSVFSVTSFSQATKFYLCIY